ncbi:PilN domain-containing protein [Dactylosporangium sp. CA-152071]|uniref:PilN domain-containing protein n=1 Tax=Dactylosporangium sp. CA-152071 TaxID=3239933 RepID=UPI003D8A1522
MTGPWWKDEPERKLTGIVLPSWDDDQPGDQPDDEPGPRARPADRPRTRAADPLSAAPSPTGPPRTRDAGPPPGWTADLPRTHDAGPLTADQRSADPRPTRAADPLTDPLTGPLDALTGPLDALTGPRGAWQDEAPAADGQRLVPLVPSGPPPVWPPADFASPAGDAPDAPRAAVRLPSLGEPLDAPHGSGPLEPHRDDTLVGSRSPQATRAAATETAAPRREFPRYIAGELVLPGTAPQPQAAPQPAQFTDAPTAPLPATLPTTLPTTQSTTQSTTLPTATMPTATPPPSTWAPQPASSPPPAERTPTLSPQASAPTTREPGQDAGKAAPVLPGVQFTAPARSPLARPLQETRPDERPEARPEERRDARPSGQAGAAQDPALKAPPHHPPAPAPAPTGLPQSDVPPPPRPTPPSVPPAQAGSPAAGPQPGPQRAPLAGPGDAATVTQPAVPAAVHAAQQGAPVAQQDQEAPARKSRDGAPHPAFPEATARSMRILPIAADLLPMEITDRRRLSTVRRLVVTALAVFALLLAGWFVVAYQHTQQAYDEVDRINDTKVDLLREKAKYTEVDSIQKQRKAIADQLRLVMARDLSWSALLTSLQQAAPKGVAVQSVTGSLAQTDSTADPDVVGLITLTGTAPSKAAIAAYVDTLGKVTGIGNPFPTDATESDEGLTFTIRVDITPAALGGRFTSPSAAPSASGGK